MYKRIIFLNRNLIYEDDEWQRQNESEHRMKKRAKRDI